MSEIYKNNVIVNRKTSAHNEPVFLEEDPSKGEWGVTVLNNGINKQYEIQDGNRTTYCCCCCVGSGGSASAKSTKKVEL